MSRTKNHVRLHESQPATPPVDGAMVIAALLGLAAMVMLAAAAWMIR